MEQLNINLAKKLTDVPSSNINQPQLLFSLQFQDDRMYENISLLQRHQKYDCQYNFSIKRKILYKMRLVHLYRLYN